MNIRKATHQDLPAMLEIMVIGSNADHTDLVKKSVTAGQCLAALIDDKAVGFGILNDSFFNHGCIALLIVHPEYRRRGVATALIRRMEQICPTVKFFTSTNKSNIPAQKTYEANGFIRSGYIENLDEDDPEIIYFKRLAVAGDRGKP